MHVKSFIVTVGLSAAAGAAAMLMIPKNSKVYRTATNAADTIKMEAGRMMDIFSSK